MSAVPATPHLLPANTSPGALRREDDALLRGAGRYVQDVHLPGALQLMFVRSEQAHATLLRVDCAAARAASGVVAVFTAADFGPVFMPAINPLLDVPGDVRFPLLASGELCYVGQPVALVLAHSRSAAQVAAALVVLDTTPLPVALDFAETAATTRVSFQCGTPAAPAAHRARVQLRSPRVAAMAMEPRACCASWDAANAALTVWLGTQTPARAQADIAHALNLTIEKVRVISPDVGGAFGFKASVYPEELLVALAARLVQGSVRWQSSRSDDFVSGMHGRGSRMQGELALDEAGHFVSLQARLHFTHGAWLPYSAVVPLRNAARILPGPYALRNLDIPGHASRSNLAPVNIYRGAGRPEAALLMETLVEQAARQSGIDAVELRRRNLVPAASMPWRSGTGETLDSGDYAQLLDRACARFGYATERARQAQREAAGELVGIGLALYVEPCGQGFEVARVSMQPDGQVSLASGAPAQGQGHATTFAQIAARELGCAESAVAVLLGDTALCPPGVGALASRSTAIGGSAIVQACRELRSRVQAGEALPVTVEARFTAAEAWAAGCVIVRLRIDAQTGAPHIERVVWADDAGHIINPTLAKGQLLGGAAQGLGQALMEALVHDDTGQLLTGSLMDYAVPRAHDMPAIEFESIVTLSPNNLLGAKGVGEAGCIGVPAAIMNAARDALRHYGEPELQLPLTAEQLWRVLRMKSQA